LDFLEKVAGDCCVTFAAYGEKGFLERILGTVGRRRLLPPADEASCEPWAVHTVFELACKQAMLKDELFQSCCVDLLLDFAKMHKIVQATPARLQNSAESCVW